MWSKRKGQVRDTERETLMGDRSMEWLPDRGLVP